MITDRSKLFHRYWNALAEYSDDGSIILEPGAVRLALRLAIDEAIATHAVALPQPSTADRIAEWRQNQINRLNDWLQVHEPGLYISPGDTADATLAAIGYRDQRIAGLLADLEQLQTDADAECAGLQEDLTSAHNELALLIAERDGLRQQLVVTDADNARLINSPTATSPATRTNGAEPPANPTTTPDWNRNHPAWDGMSDEQRVIVYRLTTGNLSFRRLNKEERLDLVRRVLRHLAAVVDPLIQFHFDRMRPDWMPMATTVVALVKSRKWKDLLAMALEPTTA